MAWWRALLGRLFPGRGRHQQLPGDDDSTLVFPRVQPWDDQPSPGEVTRLDIPPAQDRPYVDPGEWIP